MKPIFKELTEAFYEQIKMTADNQGEDPGEATIAVAEYLKKLYFIELGLDETWKNIEKEHLPEQAPTMLEEIEKEKYPSILSIMERYKINE